MIFERVSEGGCQSYVIACPKTYAGAIIDPEVRQVDHYRSLATRAGIRIRYVVDTHTHADHFSATLELAKELDVPVVMHKDSPAPFVKLRLDDGDMLAIGTLHLRAIHTPGHTRDSMCLLAGDRLFTGDTLLIGGTGRTDLPTGDPNQLYDSLFESILKLDPATKVHPAHDYKGLGESTIARELTENPRLQKRERADFTRQMRELNLTAPTHITEALRTNMSGGKTVHQLLAQASAVVPFMALADLNARLVQNARDLVVLDVREKEAYDDGHIPTARHLPRGQLELRVDQALPDPTARIVVYCEIGKVSTLAAATLRELGFMRATALEGGMKAWRAGGFNVE